MCVTQQFIVAFSEPLDYSKYFVNFNGHTFNLIDWMDKTTTLQIQTVINM